MKRANLVLDEKLLEETLSFTKAKTYSKAVNIALDEFCRWQKVKQIYDFKGSKIWEGDITKMREDSR